MTSASLNALNYLNVVAYVANALITFLAGFGEFGETNAYVSAKYQTIITPAGWAFSIWSLIFISELLFVLVQLAPGVRDSALVQKGVGYGWIAASIFQCAWSLAFAREQLELSTVFITLIFVSLGGVVRRCASIDRSEASNIFADLICRLPLTIHFGWLAAATMLNVNLVAVEHGSSAGGQLACGIVSLALVFALTVALAPKDFTGSAIPVGVACWALVAIGSNLDSPMDKDQCEAQTGGFDCNMISEIFDDTTIDGVQKSAYALSVVCGVTALLSILSGLTFRSTKSTATTSASDSSSEVSAFQMPLI